MPPVVELADVSVVRGGATLLTDITWEIAEYYAFISGHAERAFAYDDRWRAALRDGDVDELRSLEPELATDLLARGRAPLQVLAGAVGERRVRSTVLLDDDPWGVAYLVGVWTCG